MPASYAEWLRFGSRSGQERRQIEGAIELYVREGKRYYASVRNTCEGESVYTQPG